MERKAKIHMGIVIIFILIFSYYLYISGIFTDVDSLISYVQSFGTLASIIFFILVIIEVIAVPIPGLILYVAGGILFGAFIGGTIALVGNIIGSSLAFGIARYYRMKHLEKKVVKKERKIFNKFLGKYGIYSMFLLRINPLTSSDIFSYLAGLTKMPFKQFIIGTALGLLPLVYIQAYIGEDIIGQNPLLLYLFVILSIIYLVVFLYFLYSIFRKKK